MISLKQNTIEIYYQTDLENLKIQEINFKTEK